MSVRLIVLVSVILTTKGKGKDWREETKGVKIPDKRDFGGILLNQEHSRNRRHITRPVRKKKKQKQRSSCKKNPLQIKCINKKFSKRFKTIEGKMKKYANKGKVSKVEKLLTSRMNKISANMTKNTNSIGRSKTKLEEVANSLTLLQSNMSSLWLGGSSGGLTSNLSTNGTILEQLNATRYFFHQNQSKHLLLDLT